MFSRYLDEDIDEPLSKDSVDMAKLCSDRTVSRTIVAQPGSKSYVPLTTASW